LDVWNFTDLKVYFRRMPLSLLRDINFPDNRYCLTDFHLTLPLYYKNKTMACKSPWISKIVYCFFNEISRFYLTQSNNILCEWVRYYEQENHFKKANWKLIYTVINGIFKAGKCLVVTTKEWV
jgi:hypothetical protein